jgi:hypothetical protein
MTIEELRRVKTREVSHFTFAGHYITNEETDIKGLYVHTRVGRDRDGRPTNNMKVKYTYFGKEYKTLEEVLKAINDEKGA